MTGDLPLPEGLADATRRSGVVWVTPYGAHHDYLLWHLWHDGRVYLVTGGEEQELPACATARVTVRDKTQQAGRAAEWDAAVEQVRPGTALWDEIVPLLHARRLNAPDGEDQPARWARESVVLQLTPVATV